MITTRARQAIAAGLAALTLGFAAGSAQAAVYSGRWDPAFGGIFPDLGWKGSATFILPDSCLGMTGSFANAAAGCGGGAMQVTNAQIEFYNHTTDPAGLTVLQTLNAGNAPTVNGMTIASSGGVTSLLGVDTGFFQGALGAISVAEYNGNDYYFYLIMHGDQAALFYTRDASVSGGCGTGPFGEDPSNCGFSKTAAHITFTPAIPEPTTWAMFGIGLAMLWSMRRHLASAGRGSAPRA
jgi:hypothetical protein